MLGAEGRPGGVRGRAGRGSPKPGRRSCTREDRLTVLRKDLLLELRDARDAAGDGPVRGRDVRDLPLRPQPGHDRGQLAAGVLTVTLLFAAMLGINRLFVAEREQGGFDAFLLAPVDRPALLVAKATALFLFLAALEVIAVPAFGLFLLGPSLGPALPGLILVLALANLALAVIGTLVSAIAVQTRARDLIGPMIGLPLLIPALIATARAAGPLLAAATARAPPGRWLVILASMMWCSPCWLTRSSTSSWRTECHDHLRQRSSRPRARHRSSRSASRSRWSSSTRRWTPTRASCRRSSTSTSRWRSSRCAGSSSAASSRCYLRTGERKWDMRSYVAIHMALIFGDRRAAHRRDLGQGLVGPLVGVERADAGLLPDRDAAVRHLPAASLLDRGSRAPVALRGRVRDRRRRLRAAQLHRGPRRPPYVHPRVLTLDRRQPAGLDAAHVPGVAGRRRAALRDPVEVRDGGQERPLAGPRLRRALLGEDLVRPVGRSAAPL